MTDERKRLLMVGLLAVLALVVVWQYAVPWLSGGDGGLPGRTSGPVTTGASDVQVSTLDLEELEAEPRDYQPGRNPFEYYRKPPPPPPPPREPTAEELAAQRAEEERRRLEAERRAEERAEQERQAAIPKPPPFQLTYLGSFGPESRKIAVFSDGEQIYNAVVGDVLNEKFVVSDIGFESVSITYVGFPEEPATRVGIGG